MLNLEVLLGGKKIMFGFGLIFMIERTITCYEINYGACCMCRNTIQLALDYGWLPLHPDLNLKKLGVKPKRGRPRTKGTKCHW